MQIDPGSNVRFSATKQSRHRNNLSLQRFLHLLTFPLTSRLRVRRSYGFGIKPLKNDSKVCEVSRHSPNQSGHHPLKAILRSEKKASKFTLTFCRIRLKDAWLHLKFTSWKFRIGWRNSNSKKTRCYWLSILRTRRAARAGRPVTENHLKSVLMPIKSTTSEARIYKA